MQEEQEHTLEWYKTQIKELTKELNELKHFMMHHSDVGNAVPREHYDQLMEKFNGAVEENIRLNKRVEELTHALNPVT